MPKKKILIIDDDQDLTKVLKKSLEKTGRYEIKTENRGTYALAAVKSFLPDLILLDIMMPQLSGGEIGGQVREDPVLKGIPLLFMTAAVTKEELGTECRNIGGHPFIAKPIKINELIECIERHIKT